MAFVLIAAGLLQHLFSANSRSDSNDSEEVTKRISKIATQLDNILPSSKQLLMFLGGCGGTGKSRVIQAVVDFARRWNSTSTVVITALSGIAAMLIGGCTLHSALGIGTYGKPRKPSPNLMNSWSRIGILIIDEISMMQASLLDLLDSRLQQLKTRLDKPFGGIHIVFCGDFYQLAPVGMSLIPSGKPIQSNNKKAMSGIVGQELWKSCLSDVVLLDQNVRQSDPEWADSLLRWRVNEPTMEDIALVNEKFISNKTLQHSNLPIGSIPVAVCDNASREKALQFSMQEALRKNPMKPEYANNWRLHGILLIQAKIRNTEGNHRPVETRIQEYVRNLDSQRLEGAGNLFCIRNAPYMMRINQNVKKGVANGTTATLRDVILAENAEVRITSVSNQHVFAVFADEVECLIFEHNLKGWKTDKTSFPSLPAGCFPLTHNTKTTTVPLGMYDEKLTVKTTLFPCELATVLTGHKMQGQTLQSIVLGNLLGKHKYGSTGWIYVILSRVTTISGLHVMTRLEEEPKKYRSRKDVKDEMKRLGQIEQNTIRRLKSNGI